MALETMLVPRMEPKAIRHSGKASGSEGFWGVGASGFGGGFFLLRVWGRGFGA